MLRRIDFNRAFNFSQISGQIIFCLHFLFLQFLRVRCYQQFQSERCLIIKNDKTEHCLLKQGDRN